MLMVAKGFSWLVTISSFHERMLPNSPHT